LFELHDHKAVKATGWLPVKWPAWAKRNSSWRTN